MNKHLDQIRRVFSITESELAKLLGVDKSTLSRYRNGMTNTPRAMMRHIETLLILNDEQRDQIKGERIA